MLMVPWNIAECDWVIFQAGEHSVSDLSPETRIHCLKGHNQAPAKWHEKEREQGQEVWSGANGNTCSSVVPEI